MGIGPKDVAAASPAMLEGWARELLAVTRENPQLASLARLLQSAASGRDAAAVREKNQKAAVIAQAIELVRSGKLPGTGGAEDVKGGIVLRGAEDVKGGIVLQGAEDVKGGIVLEGPPEGRTSLRSPKK